MAVASTLAHIGSERLILLTGATGYVGGRLLHALEARGERVRCLSRRPEYLQPRVAPTTEVVRGDVLQPATIAPALVGVDTVYYLVHSMSSSRPFDEADRRAALAFGEAAREAGVRKVIYLGGLGRGELSPHLASRQEVGEILRASGVPTIEFRASIVIGSGQRIVRDDPRARREAARDGDAALGSGPCAADRDRGRARLPARGARPRAEGGELFEIGGSDRVTYLELMQEYASQRGLRRTMIPVPVLTPRLSSLWLWLVTPVYAGVGRKLVDSLKNETVVEDDRALEAFRVRPRGIHDAIARALAFEDMAIAQTRWSDEAFAEKASYRRGAPAGHASSTPVRPPWRCRRRGLCADPVDRRRDGLVQGRGALEAAWAARRSRRRPGPPPGPARSGRSRGRRHGRLLARRGVRARSPAPAQGGDEGAGPRLAAVRGLGRRRAERGSTITQTAIFDPSGLFGLVYWYGLWPFHGYIFGGMLRNIVAAATAARR